MDSFQPLPNAMSTNFYLTHVSATGNIQGHPSKLSMRHPHRLGPSMSNKSIRPLETCQMSGNRLCYRPDIVLEYFEPFDSILVASGKDQIVSNGTRELRLNVLRL